MKKNEFCKNCAAVFRSCFDDLFVSDEIIAEKLAAAELITECDALGTVLGFAAVVKNSIALLCVHPDYQGSGMGTDLLVKAEEHIRNQGYDRVILGRSSCRIFYGAVIGNMSHSFFEKNGYSAANGCLSMYMFDEDFPEEFVISPDTEFQILSGKADDDILCAVQSVEPKWIKHFESCDGKYKYIIKALTGGKTSGFMMLDTNARTIVTDSYGRTCQIDYVGVVPGERNKGTGTAMVSFALNWVMNHTRCTEAFISYTSLDEWYSRMGFEDYLWYWMGEKKL